MAGKTFWSAGFASESAASDPASLEQAEWQFQPFANPIFSLTQLSDISPGNLCLAIGRGGGGCGVRAEAADELRTTALHKS